MASRPGCELIKIAPAVLVGGQDLRRLVPQSLQGGHEIPAGMLGELGHVIVRLPQQLCTRLRRTDQLHQLLELQSPPIHLRLRRPRLRMHSGVRRHPGIGRRRTLRRGSCSCHWQLWWLPLPAWRRRRWDHSAGGHRGRNRGRRALGTGASALRRRLQRGLHPSCTQLTCGHRHSCCFCRLRRRRPSPSDIRSSLGSSGAGPFQRRRGRHQRRRHGWARMA
mmetsp:Transcript_101748/g.303660  ORF Transcript_101748/g.303660 Transcript_101748/m.303660 type:complete len:221 (+) Transcript_101748:329-991(+)